MLKCDCGFEARAADEQALVEEIRRHAREAHGMALSNDEALLLAFRAELNATPSRGRVLDAAGGLSEAGHNSTRPGDWGPGSIGKEER